MVKKTDNPDFVNTVRDSAQQIWLAGLGAFAKAQAEGSKVFESLVKEGSTVQRKTQAVAEGKLMVARNKGERLPEGWWSTVTVAFATGCRASRPRMR